jgi:hypothetical protein
MLLKTLGVASAVALVAVSVAVAAPPVGKGKPDAPGAGAKPPATGVACKPKISVILRGALTTDGAAVPSTVTLNLAGGNHFAKAYLDAKTPLVVALTADTRIVRGGSHNPLDLKVGDLVNVRASVCKADLAHGAMPPLTAVRLVAHPPKTS